MNVTGHDQVVSHMAKQAPLSRLVPLIFPLPVFSLSLSLLKHFSITPEFSRLTEDAQDDLCAADRGDEQ